MADIALQCRVATTFGKDGAIDELAFRRYLQRFIDTKIDVYLASAGSGEGHALTWQELRRVYEIGVSECKGKVEVNANPPDQHTSMTTIEHARLAIDCGVEVVNLYPPAAWHGYKPRGDELQMYFDTVLREINHPVALAPNPTIGQPPSASLVADLCRRFTQIVAVNLVGTSETYFMELRASINRDVRLFVEARGTPNTLALGAAGMIGGNLNLLPKTYRAFGDRYRTGDIRGMAELYSQMLRAADYTKPFGSPNSRVVKMFITAFRLPGWEGGMREPCRLPPAAEIYRFTQGLLRLDIPEFNELADGRDWADASKAALREETE